MLGILIQLTISWLLVWWFFKQNLTVLGILPTRIRLVQFALGFLVAAVCMTLYTLTTTYLAERTWALNKNFTAGNLLTSLWWNISSVLFEELIFRGALLYILLRKIGITKACLVSAVAFGVYHWFSYGAWGSPVQLIYVFFSTGLWGYMYAIAFAKTKSLYLPTGLHLGWNLMNITVFSQGPLGIQLLENSTDGEMVEGLPSLFLFVFQLLTLPTLVLIYLKRQVPESDNN